MNKRSNGDMNGRGIYPHPEASQRLLTKKHPPRSPLLPALTILCLGVGLAVAIATQDNQPPGLPGQNVQTEAFRWAVNRAMSAAELTQTAASREDWQTVVNWWQEAIELMKTVPATNPKYQIAKEKVLEYQRNLAYAKGKSFSNGSPEPISVGVWSVGSRRSEIVKAQGQPSQSVRYDSLCQEVLYYNQSTIELNNGFAVKYEDVDKNLKVDKDSEPPAPPTSDSWTLGSTRDQVFRIQGTPERVNRFDTSQREILYYGSSTVELTQGRVTGYINQSNNLRVAVAPLSLEGQQPISTWSLNSERNDVFRVQGTPNQVVLDNSLCREVLYYGNSTVELRNGFVSAYDNLDNNLRVKVR